jgi:hypothetical protein
MRTTWLFVVVLVVGLGAGREARAAGKVDWSDYLEPAGSRTSATTQRPAKAATTTKKASRAEAKKHSAKSKSKKTKRSARTTRRR